MQYFGLGEVTGNITVLRPDMHTAENAGSCGVPRTGMEVAILDESGARLPPDTIGEICVRGPAVFAGYFENDEANRKAFAGGWFHTGDLGRLDARGFGELKVVEATELRHSDLKAVNSKKEPLKVKPVTLAGLSTKSDRITLELQPASWNVVRLES